MMRVLSILASLLAFVVGGVSAAQAADWPANVRAVYDINFNGFNVGAFEFQSQSEEESYSLTGNAQLTLLLGAFTWIGETRAFGLIADRMPKPAAFAFDFKANSKTGSTKMDFADGVVADIKHIPPPIPKPGTVPLRQQHLKGVLDPLSAIMVVARASNPNPCDRRLPIFDGKERFDLVLSYKGQMKVNEQQPSGQPAIAHVCKVKYQPIAGHKVDTENSFMATTDAIEVALRPVPSANVLIPYQITIPTMVGYATLVSRRVEIDTPGQPQIALLH
ncbi:MAG: DUF3108 domain-containing protein [Hyphomonadaceae bacterium]|jgi:hypothetical protein|nr:DUF3108 domain-containing protein [Hyphomonadaceae bacterium]